MRVLDVVKRGQRLSTLAWEASIESARVEVAEQGLVEVLVLVLGDGLGRAAGASAPTGG